MTCETYNITNMYLPDILIIERNFSNQMYVKLGHP